jgi:predicted dehydrogenase
MSRDAQQSAAVGLRFASRLNRFLQRFMRFALLGDHPDGLDMSAAFVATGRHELAVYSGPPAGLEALRSRNVACRSIPDLEEVLADPAIEAVIVASRPSMRGQQLRRALQSERHVLCVHPPEPSPDIGYEAALIQADTKHVLLPLLPDALHPGVVRLAEWIRAHHAENPFRCLQLERWIVGPLFQEWGKRPRASFPDWTALRALAGEIAEVSAFASAEEIAATEPLLFSGRFEGGGLFQASLLPGQREARWRVQVLGSSSEAELILSAGWRGPARLELRDEGREPTIENWEAWDPWPALVPVFESAIQAPARSIRNTRPCWQDAVRALELDDAVRRSVERRRASTMEYQEVSEAVGFKGTMTLVGCAMLWGLLILLGIANWYPPVMWAIPVLLAAFLAMQVLRWLLPASQEQGEASEGEPADEVMSRERDRPG